MINSPTESNAASQALKERSIGTVGNTAGTEILSVCGERRIEAGRKEEKKEGRRSA